MLRTWKWLNLLLSTADSPSLVRRLCQQQKYFYSGAIVIGLTFILSSILLKETAASTDSFLDRLSASFKGVYRESNEFNSSEVHNVRALPRGIIRATTDLQFRSLVDEDESWVQENMPKNLLAMAVGIKQKKIVDDIVQKFPLRNFTIMLFHYDGAVEQWHDLPWSEETIHISALRQTKWWYAKRFLHPDIVAQYNYIFLWDEDLGVENFNAERYLKIMEAEGLEISQPALDNASLDVHHPITRRQSQLKAHKRILRNRGSTKCTKESNGPPCTGFVEVMAPVFSKLAWRCVWNMVQNDLVHGWGIDFKIGYCAQGDRTEKVGVIDEEYILHKGIPSLGGHACDKTGPDQRGRYHPTFIKRNPWAAMKNMSIDRAGVRRRSGQEMNSFLSRWNKAVSEDLTWKNPYIHMNDSSGNYHGK